MCLETGRELEQLYECGWLGRERQQLAAQRQQQHRLSLLRQLSHHDARLDIEWPRLL